MSEHADIMQREAGDGQSISSSVEPVYIYLYYLKFGLTQVGPVETRAYFCCADGDTYNQAQVDGFVRAFGTNAYMNGSQPRSIGPSLDAMPRYMKGIVAIVVDVPGQKPGSGTLTFAGEFNNVSNDASHTLSPPRQIGITVPDGSGGTRDIIAFYSLNGLNEPDMSDLDSGESEHFTFTLRFAQAARGFPYSDSGGTNMGPPTGPPYLYGL